MNNKTIICFHGYGKRRSIQFNYLKEKLGNKYDFICPDYYTLQENDNDYKAWLARAESELIKHQDENIIIIGFSLGATVASYFANKYNVKKLILLSACFEYDNFLKVKRAKPEISIPACYLDTFVDVIDNCASSIKNVECPITFVHAKGDETIPYDSAISHFKMCKNPKCKFISLEAGQHMLFDDATLKYKTVSIIDEELENAD